MNLYPYQEEGARFLASLRRGMLMDGMRVGKTPQAIAAADLVGARNVLVVCPGLAREVWARAFQKFSLLDRPVATVMQADDAIEPNGVTILSMDGARNGNLHARVMPVDWDVVILDECHFLKDPNSQRTRQVLSRVGFAAKAKRIWFLSGTPMLNSPSDLWVALRTIGVFKGDFEAFLNKFCVWFPGDYGPVVKDAKNTDELKRIMAPVTLRRTWSEVKGQVMTNPLPDPKWHNVDLEYDGSAEDDSLIAEIKTLEDSERVMQTLNSWLEQIEAGADVDKLMTKVRERANIMALRRAIAIVKSGIVARWLIDRLATDEIDKAVVFCHHSKMVEMMRAYLDEYGAKSLYGGTPMEKRQKYIDGFNEKAHRRVLVCQDNIARQAIDLSASCHLVFGEMDFVAENNAQAAMRIQGPLQKRQPHIWVTHLKQSTDDVITKICLRKTKMAAQILG